jgi:hypothetical protein
LVFAIDVPPQNFFGGSPDAVDEKFLVGKNGSSMVLSVSAGGGKMS